MRASGENSVALEVAVLGPAKAPRVVASRQGERESLDDEDWCCESDSDSRKASSLHSRRQRPLESPTA